MQLPGAYPEHKTRCSGPPAINRYGVYLPKGRFSKRGGLFQSARNRPPLFRSILQLNLKLLAMIVLCGYKIFMRNLIAQNWWWTR